MRYKFVVTDASKVDFQRILNEAPADTDAILVTAQTDNCALFLRESFLSRYSGEDQLTVVYGTLAPTWGETRIYAVNCQGGVRLGIGASRSFIPTCQNITGWRCHLTNWGHIAEVRQQLAAARAFQPKRAVKVHYL